MDFIKLLSQTKTYPCCLSNDASLYVYDFMLTLDCGPLTSVTSYVHENNVKLIPNGYFFIFQISLL